MAAAADGVYASNPAVAVQSLGPAILSSGDALGNIVKKANNLLSDHREWLANLPQLHNASPSLPTSIPPSQTSGAPSMITTPPILHNRAPIPQVPTEFCNPNSAITSASISAQSSLAAVSAASSSLQSALANATSLLTSAQSAASTASVASLSAVSSANSAIASIQGSAMAAVASANSAIGSAQASASAAIKSANDAASMAKATATLAQAQAQASVSSVNSQASQAVSNVRLQAMTSTRFALIIAFSILGSSILSILIFYFIILLRRRSRERREDRKLMISYPREKGRSRSRGADRAAMAMREGSEGGRWSSTDNAAILAEFPLPVNVTSWQRARSNPPSSRGRDEYQRVIDAARGAATGGLESQYQNRFEQDQYQYRDPARQTVAGNDFEQPRYQDRDPARQTVTGNGFEQPQYQPRDPARQTVAGNRFQSQDQYQGTPPVSRDTNLVRQTMSEYRGTVPSEQRGRKRDSTPKTMTRTTTLTYDPERPTQPPRFRSWWEENGGDLDKKGEDLGKEDAKDKRRSVVDRVLGRKSLIGTAF